uniref:RAMP superfamily CRISPR-associated protein n=3 Tax=Pseudomonadati TaxID=3379134 RepID=UPI004048D9C0
MPKEFTMRDQYRLLALVELEALSAHGVFTGHGEGTKDNQLVRDANGLPALPSSSVAGVLRHAISALYGHETAEELFGFANGDQGKISKIALSWALALDSKGKCHQGLTALPENDDVIQLLSREQPITRPRVRLNQRGSAENGGLFHLAFAPKGTRYRLFIELSSDNQEALQEDWLMVQQALESPMLRFGHGTHSGYGAFMSNTIKVATYNLLNGDVMAYAARTRDRNSDAELTCITRKNWPDVGRHFHVHVQAEGGLAIGGGTQPHSKEKNPALIPMHEAVIHWSGQHATIQEQIVIPGSSLKGALAHRTEFYANLLTGNWANDHSTNHAQSKHDLVSSLFGNASDTCSSGDDLGRAGQLFFEDIYISNPTIATQMHNKIDPFTGGTVTGALFCDEMLWQPELKISIWLKTSQIDQRAITAFELAMEDLKTGMLPLGARSGRGMGILLEAATEGDIA